MWVESQTHRILVCWRLSRPTRSFFQIRKLRPTEVKCLAQVISWCRTQSWTHISRLPAQHSHNWHCLALVPLPLEIKKMVPAWSTLNKNSKVLPKALNPNQMQQLTSAEYQIIFSAYVLLTLTWSTFKSIRESSQNKRKTFSPSLIGTHRKIFKKLYDLEENSGPECCMSLKSASLSKPGSQAISRVTFK